MSQKAAIELKKKREQLNTSLKRKKAVTFIRENTQLIDDYFFESFQQARSGQDLNLNGFPFAVVAQGGYGRGEQCVHSDVDILILFDKKVPDKTEALVREIIYPLWDIGLEVGHATRSVDECVRLAASDLEVLTSLLDARFICGMSPIFTRMTNTLKEKVVDTNPSKMINRIKKSCEERHQNFGDSSDLIEPNLKNGLGGLRDYHTIMWLGRIKSCLKDHDDLKRSGFLSKADYDAFMDALEFIWNVRNRLHLLVGRKTDQLHFEYQESIASSFKFIKKDGQQPVERFMGVLHAKMEFVKQNHLMFLSEFGQSKKFFFSTDMFKRSKVQGITVSKSLLTFTSKEAVKKSPELLMSIFSESSRLKLPLSASAKRIVSECGHLADSFRFSYDTTRIFERIMGSITDEFNAVNEMLSTGFLVRLLPEFDTISNRIQYNQYHIYPVDRHSVHVLQAVRNFTSKENMISEPFFGNLYYEIASKKVLHWAALFHDIGKGEPGGEHSASGAAITSRLLLKRGVRQKHIDQISFLIEHHLFLINIAKRRDIDDVETVMMCARKIKDPDMLKMLYLLTVADSVSTGPNAWNNWTACLLRDLFFKVLEILEKGDLVSIRKEKSIQNKREKLLNDDNGFKTGKTDLEALIDSMSPRYLLNNSNKRIVAHIKLFESMGDSDFSVKVRKVKQSSNRNAVVCGPEKPGFFSMLAGIFTLNDFDILDAQIYMWGKKTAIDIFTLKPFYDHTRETERWVRINSDIKGVLEGRIDLYQALSNKAVNPVFKKPQLAKGKPVRVEIDNTSSSFFTIVEVYSYDFPGLLFALTNALYNFDLDIVYAKIATHVEQVVDIFYVRTLREEKVDSPEDIQALKKTIMKSIRKFEPIEDEEEVVEF